MVRQEKERDIKTSQHRELELFMIREERGDQDAFSTSLWTSDHLAYYLDYLQFYLVGHGWGSGRVGRSGTPCQCQGPQTGARILETPSPPSANALPLSSTSSTNLLPRDSERFQLDSLNT